MADDEREPDDTISLAEWLDRLLHALPERGGLMLTAGEQAALLDLARIAAHTSERIAAPLSTFVAGVALADVPRADRERHLRRVIAELEG